MNQDKLLLQRAKYFALAICRKNRRISRGELSEMSSISIYQIEQYEHGKKEIPYRQLDVLLKSMDVSEEMYLNQIVKFITIYTKEMKACVKQTALSEYKKS